MFTGSIVALVTPFKNGGINFETLKQEIVIPESKLRNIIKDLILESRIYESDNDNFEAF